MRYQRKGKCGERGLELIHVGKLNARYLKPVERSRVLDEVLSLAAELRRLGLDTLPGCWKAIA